MKNESLEALRWKKSPNYLGADYSVYFVAYTQTRDSGAIERANFKAVRSIMGRAGKVVSFGHWACGWVEHVLVKDTSKRLDSLADIMTRLENYPVLDEEALSNEEHEEAREIVESNPVLVKTLREFLQKKTENVPGNEELESLAIMTALDENGYSGEFWFSADSLERIWGEGFYGLFSEFFIDPATQPGLFPVGAK